jgi:hypothetical protein
LMGIVIAGAIVARERPDALALPAAFQFGEWLGILVVAALAFALYRVASQPATRAR